MTVESQDCNFRLGNRKKDYSQVPARTTAPCQSFGNNRVQRRIHLSPTNRVVTGKQRGVEENCKRPSSELSSKKIQI